MSERLVRLLKIITYVQNRPGITSRELTERLEISKRTLQRDIQVLGEANVPVVYDEATKGYKFLGRFALFPLDWTERERRAFYMLPSLLEKIPNMFTPETLDAIHKVISAEGRNGQSMSLSQKSGQRQYRRALQCFFKGILRLVFSPFYWKRSTIAEQLERNITRKVVRHGLNETLTHTI